MGEMNEVLTRGLCGDPSAPRKQKGPEAGGMGPYMDICHFPVLVCADIPQVIHVPRGD